VLDTGEACDDGGQTDDDGCSATCGVEDGWSCSAEAACTEIEGDGLVVGDETCDDGNTDAGDGCSGGAVEAGWSCDGEPSVCDPSSDDSGAADVGTDDAGNDADAGAETGSDSALDQDTEREDNADDEPAATATEDGCGCATSDPWSVHIGWLALLLVIAIPVMTRGRFSKSGTVHRVASKDSPGRVAKSWLSGVERS
jgi:MYXO-CTERM domain-containing protein